MSTTDRAELTKILAENFNSSLWIKMEKSRRPYELETFADGFFSWLNTEYNNFILIWIIWFIYILSLFSSFVPLTLFFES